ncbi:MAG: type II secretion system F family protein [Oscillospiraceae bacterium]|nr:type II secretion system F family protein [Oscillospiraceae bacterium]
MKKYRGLANTYLSVFCMELSMIMQSGISIAEGVYLLLDEETDADGKRVLKSLLDPLEDGLPLSAALKKSPYFPKYMVNMAEVGEKTGRLSETLKSLSVHYERMDRVAVAVKNAILYPGILLLMMMAVVLILIIGVLPIFSDVFERLGSNMSTLASNLMRFGEWLSGASVVFAAIFGLIFIIALALWVFPKFRGGARKLLGKVWGNRGLMRETASARFISAMSLALASGLDTQEAVTMAAAVSGGTKAANQKYDACMEHLQAGHTLPDAMRHAGIISVRDSRFLSLGATSGMADAAMADIARRAENNVQDHIENVVGRIEPTLIIITSLIVGVVLLSVMLPLMGIMTSLG